MFDGFWIGANWRLSPGFVNLFTLGLMLACSNFGAGLGLGLGQAGSGTQLESVGAGHCSSGQALSMLSSLMR